MFVMPFYTLLGSTRRAEMLEKIAAGTLARLLRSGFDDCDLMEPTIIISATNGRSMMIITMLVLLPIKDGAMEERPSEGRFRPILTTCRVQETSSPLAVRP